MNIDKYPGPFSPIERSIIFGSLLGDGHVALNGNCALFVEGHSRKQRGYLEWKAEKLSRFNPKLSDGWSTLNGRKYPNVTLTTVAIPLFLDVHHLTYPQGKKLVSSAWLEYIDDLALAVWVFDDGNFKPSHSAYRIGVTSRSESERVLLIEMLNRFGIAATNQKQSLWISRESAVCLAKILQAFAVECMQYKVMDASRMRRRLRDHHFFILENWKTMSDRELGAILKFHPGSIKNFRRRHRLVRVN